MVEESQVKIEMFICTVDLTYMTVLFVFSLNIDLFYLLVIQRGG